MIIVCALNGYAFSQTMPCRNPFYKMSGDSIITVCKSEGITYYDSLSAVLTEFVYQSGIKQGDVCYISQSEDKTGQNEEIAKFVKNRLEAKLKRYGVKISREPASGATEIKCSFEGADAGTQAIYLYAGNSLGEQHSDIYHILNSVDLSEYADMCSVPAAPKSTPCKCEECKKCGSRISLTDEIAKFFPNKPLYFVLGGLLIILIGIILGRNLFYPRDEKKIWGIISMFIAGLVVCTGGLFGLAMPSWGWPLCTTVSALITLALVLLWIFGRNMGFFRKP